MIAYGNVAGRVHRAAQRPPEAFCAVCGASLGGSWTGGLCGECSRRRSPVPDGMRRCHRCRRTKPKGEFVDGRGRTRACCAGCRKAAASAAAKYRARNGKEGR